jgi:GTPase SAR1 family protein
MDILLVEVEAVEILPVLQVVLEDHLVVLVVDKVDLEEEQVVDQDQETQLHQTHQLDLLIMVDIMVDLLELDQIKQEVAVVRLVLEAVLQEILVVLVLDLLLFPQLLFQRCLDIGDMVVLEKMEIVRLIR